MPTKEIKGPASDIAKDEMLAVEEANVRIKELIIEATKTGTPKKELETAIQNVIEETANQIKNPATREMFIDGIRASTQRWYMIQTQAIKSATIATVNQLAKVGIKVAEISAGYGDAEKFRPFVSNNPKGLPIIENYQKRVRESLKVLVHDNPTAVIYTKNGPRRASLRNRVETEIRYEANMKDLQDMKNDGVKLVITTTHADCSKRCEHWQGQIFTLGDKPVKINGKKYLPLKLAMLGENKDGNGIINGYNCRHRAVPYTPGMVMPTEYSAEEIRKRRAVNSKMRYMEREIRSMKVQERLLRTEGTESDLTTAKKLREKWRVKQSEYKAYSLKNGNAYEEWRCRIGNEEKEQIIESTKTVQELSKENYLFDELPEIMETERTKLDKKIMQELPGGFRTDVGILKERYEHITKNHPEMKDKQKEIMSAVTDPDLIIKYEENEKTYLMVKSNGKNSIVATVKFAETKDKKLISSVITAYTKNTRRIINDINKSKEAIVYKKEQIDYTENKDKE